MSIKQMSVVWEYEFKPAEQQVMLALADHAHDDGTEIRPSVARLAWKTGYSERQVHRVLARLRDDLGILVLTKKGGGRGFPNVYRFDWTKGVKKSAFRTRETLTSDGVNPDNSDINPDTAMSYEPSLEPSSIEPSFSPEGAEASSAPEDELQKRRGRNEQDGQGESATTNWMSFFCDMAKDFGYSVQPEDRKELPRNLKIVSKNADEKTMRQVVMKCLEARSIRGYPISPQRAKEDLENGIRGGGGRQAQGHEEKPRTWIDKDGEEIDFRRMMEKNGERL